MSGSVIAIITSITDYFKIYIYVNLFTGHKPLTANEIQRLETAREGLYGKGYTQETIAVPYDDPRPQISQRVSKHSSRFLYFY